MRFLILIAFLLVFSSISTAEITFARTYPLDGYDSNSRVYELPDGGYVVIHKNCEDYHDRFIRLDEYGNRITLLDKFIDALEITSIGEQFSYVVPEIFHQGTHSIVQVRARGSFWSKLEVVFRDQNGDSIDCWITPVSLTDLPEPSAVCETPNGGIIIVGFNHYMYQAFALRLDSSGASQWYEDNFEYLHGTHSVDILNDGSYLMSGGCSWLAQVNEDGLYQYHSFNLFAFQPFAHDSVIACIPDDISSYTAFRANLEGETVWIFDTVFPLQQNMHGCIGLDGTIVVCGFTYIDWPDVYYPFLIAMSTDGEPLWQRVITEYRGVFERIIPTSDGGYICSGYSGTWPDTDLLVIKMDSEGNFPPLGIEDEAGPVQQGFDLSTQPNPSNQFFSISFTLQETSDVSLDIYDITGRLASQPLNGCCNAGFNTLEVPDLPSGIYLIRLEANGVTESVRQIVL